ncbi:hypothetical protein [Chondromyces crocatus]|uniref:Uncharacterized protein n=1 Tax=Chondromyces crocatus TaxID=52 RepID=A0A0K1EHH6_CHOCO|nr:hypothetical protein [Chondromyces crocatus]AKT40326.1 uncharacterized protein CMC5_044790 [Chondromyces crocatus]
MDPTAEKLQTFLAAFSARTDVRVVVSELRPPAPEDALRAAQGQIPSELLSFYASMNGAHIAWRFIEPPGEGCLQIPPLGAATRFADDEAGGTAFGAGMRALLLDAPVPECATWYVVPEGAAADAAVLWFSTTAALDDGRQVARSLADYVTQAIEHALVLWWQAPSGEVPVWIARALAEPVAPVAIVSGGRVETQYHAEGARGVVREIRQVPLPEDSFLSCLGDRYARVDLDEGTTLWLPLQDLKGVRTRDVYEEAVARGRAFWDELRTAPMLDRIRAVARAIGPIASTSPTTSGPSNARRAAGMLSSLSLGEAVETIAALFGDASRAVPKLRESHPIEVEETAFGASAWRTFGHPFVPRDALEGLMAGLALRIARASAARGVAPRDLVPERAADLLRWVPGRASVLDLLAMETPADAPEGPPPNEKARAQLGLPGPHGVGLGTGF